MAFLTVNHIALKAVSCTVPANREDNLEYPYTSEKERELLVKTTGIRYRRVAPPFMTTSDLCFSSAERIINDLGIDRKKIGILIFVSQSPDYWLPATSIILQQRLGLSSSTIAFDIQLGCSGYVYGLSVISNLMAASKIDYGLLMVGDISTFSPNKKDKSTYPIFGDAGAVTLLQYNEKAPAMHFGLYSDGSGADAIIIPHGGIRRPFDEESYIEEEVEGVIRAKKNLALNGLEVFNFSLREAPQSVNELMEFTHTTVDDHDFFLFHQANKIMNDSIRKKLKIPTEKVPMCLHDYGNTSSATIPMLMTTQIAGRLKTGDTKLVMSAFGVGLSWATCSITTQNLHCPPLLEL